MSTRGKRRMRRIVHVYGIWPKGMWNRSGVWPPLPIERALDRYCFGRAPSIYAERLRPPERRGRVRPRRLSDGSDEIPF